jgi:hypothetical protein
MITKRNPVRVEAESTSSDLTLPAVVEVHLEELGEHSWLKALFNTLTGASGSAQFRFVARPSGSHHDVRDHVATGATFPALRFQDMDDLHEPNTWIDIARARLEELDEELRGHGWRRVDRHGAHWWSRSYRKGCPVSEP